MTSIINVKHASYSVAGRKVLNNINFTLYPGEILSVLGCNGVGKTTLLKCCLGFSRFDSGEVTIFSKPMKQISNIYSLVGYVAQVRQNFMDLSVLDMVTLGLNSMVRFSPSARDMMMSHKILDRLNISHLHDKNCSALSGGELQMVLFARALVCEPRLIVLDEIESNLDFKNQKTILLTLQDLSTHGFNNNKCSIIINTHYPQNAAFLSHKTLLVYRNRDDMDSNSIFGDASDLLTKENLSSLYGTEIDDNFCLKP